MLEKLEKMDAEVRARVDEKIKKRATKVLEDAGLTMSEALRLMVEQIAIFKKLPFKAPKPNAKTLAAMRELEQGKGKRFKSVKDLMADLND